MFLGRWANADEVRGGMAQVDVYTQIKVEDGFHGSVGLDWGE